MDSLTVNQRDCLRSVYRSQPLNGRYGTRTIRSLMDRGYIALVGVGYYELCDKARALFPALDKADQQPQNGGAGK